MHVSVMSRRIGTALFLLGAVGATAAEPHRHEFTSLVAHWTDYGKPEYVEFIRDAKPDVAQVGFYGGHFWSLAHTPEGAGYPAHFPVVGLEECGQFFEDLNAKLHAEHVKVVGHFNIKFLVGDPDGPDGPRGFFKFYRDLWNERELGPKPVADPLDLLEKNADGTPIVNRSYEIGAKRTRPTRPGMAEYWGCLNNPHWRSVLKAWCRRGIERGVDGYMINYFYRHNCLCPHCVAAFKDYLRGRFTPDQLQAQLGIADLDKHEFAEIVAWHKPEESTPLRREMLRFSQIANKRAFDEVFLDHGRRLKPDLIVAQWNHLSDFNQISGDERCLLPAELWGRGEDYLWYSTGASACYTDLAAGFLGDVTLRARYVRGAFDDKPFTFGKYEHTRIRATIAELAANGGAPMGFYTRFTEPAARDEIVRYYNFIRRYDSIYRANTPHSEIALIFPRRRIQDGDMAALATFKKLGDRLLNEHVLFDVRTDDLPLDRAAYRQVIDVADGEDVPVVGSPLSRFEAPQTVRVAANRSASGDELTIHFVNYNRTEPDKPKSPGAGIGDEKPIACPGAQASVVLPKGMHATQVELVTPESPEPRVLAARTSGGRVEFGVPEFLVYAVARIALSGQAAAAPPQQSGNRSPKIAALVSCYRPNTHADVIVSRLLQTDTLDGRGQKLQLGLASLYIHQPGERKAGRGGPDISREVAAGHNVRFSPTVADALTLGTDKLAVDGVLIVFEHGDYPRSEIDSLVYPKRQHFEEAVEVMKKSGRVVPVFIDKHLSDTWTDSKAIYDLAQRMKIPLMAGSSLPSAWRYPPADIQPDKPLKEIVVISYHLLDVYGFHALEGLQALVERRAGAEQGVQAVQCISGDAVWEAGGQGVYDQELLAAALARQRWKGARSERPLAERVKAPVLFVIEYADGVRANVLTLNGAVGEFAAAWRYADGSQESTLLALQEERPFYHFAILVRGFEQMVLTGRPSWPVERTLLTSGTLAALLTSRHQEGRRLPTPHLLVPYRSDWTWRQPPDPPPGQPRPSR